MLFGGSAAKQMAVTVIGHPICSCQMRIKCITGARGFTIRIDTQDDPSDFLPIGALGRGIKKAPIGHEMLLIVSRKHWIIGSRIGDLRSDWRRLHGSYQLRR